MEISRKVRKNCKEPQFAHWDENSEGILGKLRDFVEISRKSRGTLESNIIILSKF